MRPSDRSINRFDGFIHTVTIGHALWGVELSQITINYNLAYPQTQKTLSSIASLHITSCQRVFQVYKVKYRPANVFKFGAKVQPTRKPRARSCSVVRWDWTFYGV